MPKLSIEVLQSYFSNAQLEPNINTSSYYENIDISVLQNINRHPIYIDTVLQYYPLRLHANGDFPTKMIEDRRPSETEEILAYRKATYKPITKHPISKVLSSLTKIRRSPDWVINFEKDKVPPKIKPEETLEEYCNKNIPGYGNITDWAFNILLKQNAIDANAVVAVLPLEQSTDNTYLKPVPIVFNCDHVLEYDEERQIAIFKSRKKVNYLLDNGSMGFNMGNRFYYVDDLEFVIYDQTKDGFKPVYQQSHQLGKMPCFKVKGEAFMIYDNMVVNRSRLDAMVPFLDEATCEYSDLKGSKIQHLYPLFWYYQSRNCNSCGGTGKTTNTTGITQCTSCGGSGKVKFSPYAHIQLEPPAIGTQGTPSPPAGYITRDTAILDLQEKSVENNIYKALSAVNMQFLDQTPLNVSGQAKQVDREELNNFVYNFAEDLIASIDKTIFWINEWRYSFIIKDPVARRAMLPNIPVPMNFDLLPANYLIEEITAARRNSVNPFMLATLEEQLAEKKFYNEPQLKETIKLFFKLDPLAGLTVDEKTTYLGNNGITKEDYVISSYCSQFIRRAISDDPTFTQKKYDEQMAVLKKMAAEKMQQTDAAAQMINDQRAKVLAELKASQSNLNNPNDPNNPNNNPNPQNSGGAAGQNQPAKPFISMTAGKVE